MRSTAGAFGGWTRTGEEFHVLGAKDTNAGLDQPVCRLYLPPGRGDSHFFSASGEECAAARSRIPDAVLETGAAFYAALPDPVTGHCGNVKWPGTPFSTFACPVYRLWNGRVDSNHRYTQYPEVRDRMIARGYVSEGYGPMGVAMCVIVWAFWDYC